MSGRQEALKVCNCGRWRSGRQKRADPKPASCAGYKSCTNNKLLCIMELFVCIFLMASATYAFICL